MPVTFLNRTFYKLYHILSPKYTATFVIKDLPRDFICHLKNYLCSEDWKSTHCQMAFAETKWIWTVHGLLSSSLWKYAPRASADRLGSVWWLSGKCMLSKLNIDRAISRLGYSQSWLPLSEYKDSGPFVHFFIHPSIHSLSIHFLHPSIHPFISHTFSHPCTRPSIHSFFQSSTHSPTLPSTHPSSYLHGPGTLLYTGGFETVMTVMVLPLGCSLSILRER